MNFLKKLFTEKEKKRFFFEFQKSIISEPDLWSPAVREVVDDLAETEKRSIIRISGLLQESVEWHSQYIFRTKYTFNKLNDPEYIFKSFFELTSLNWVLVTNYFRKNKVRSEVGQALWWLIKYSFHGFDDKLFTTPPLDSFENAIEIGENEYRKLLDRYLKPFGNEIKVYGEMFNKIIEKPLTEFSGQLDFHDSYTMNFAKTPDVMVFHKHLSVGIIKFTKKLYQIKF